RLRTVLIAATAGLSSGQLTPARTTESRSRPTGPDIGFRPRPNGGTPATVSAGVSGAKDAHGSPVASTAEWAPQQLTSTSTPSSCTMVSALPRSAISYDARRPNAPIDNFSAPTGLDAFQSFNSIASMRGSMGSTETPSPR